ncbi:hypothetical protein KAW65_07360 [candidate division WOR-3 bacterium]|nr:hypothetical protein [candidate division WOR-3 bacterium]
MRQFFVRNKKLLISWVIIGIVIFIFLHFGLDKKIMAFGVIVFGFFTQAFSGLLSTINLIPVVGPFIVKIVSLPLIWIANGFAYVVTLLVLRRGHKIDIFKSRVLITALLIGIVLGFILGKLL